jgi:hypothetical protein
MITRRLYLAIWLCLLTFPAFGQWTPSGNNLYSLNNKVGIGTSNPQLGKLEIAADASSTDHLSFNDTGTNGLFWRIGPRAGGGGPEIFGFYSGSGQIMALKQGGYVGIGTANPWGKLHIAADANSISHMVFQDVSTGGLTWQIGPRAGGGADVFGFWDGANQVMVLKQGGNVGIGTNIPGYKLDIAGTARAEEVIVESAGADFVFEDDYDLRSLEEVEQFIGEHGHLPEIPSAEQMQAGGMQVGDMQTKLLQKIEELTLYIIEQNKLIAKQEVQLSTQQEQLIVQQERLEEMSTRLEQVVGL